MRDHSQAVCMHMYEKMLLIRYSEQKLEALFAEGQVHGTTHLYIGQEAVAAGVCEALEPKDLILSTHRGHGHCIAKGIDIAAMMAEFLGRETGCCGGRGGSMHIADFEHGNLGTNGIVGGGFPWPWVRRWRRKCAEKTRSRYAFSETALLMKVFFMNRSILRPYGNCLSCMSARTTNTAFLWPQALP